MFDWDAANRAHIRQHGFTEEEAEAAWLDPNHIPADATGLGSEWREAIIGMTRGGRLLHVVWTERAGRIRLFEARKPTRREARLYLRR